MAAFAAAGPGATPGAAAELPLGPRSLEERRVTTRLAPGLAWTRIARGTTARGPRWRLHVLAIDRSLLTGRVTAALSNGRIPGRERVSSIARRARAVAATNGGFFSPGGDPVGAVVGDGRMSSEPVNGRSAILIPRSRSARPEVARLRFRGSATVDGRTRMLDGVDRVRGRIPGCGGSGGDRPTQRPSTYLTCRDPSELIMFDRSFGSRTPAAAGGLEAVVRRGAVTAVRRGGSTRIPTSGYVLSGSGDAAGYLRAAARPGAPASVRADPAPGRRSEDYSAVVGVGPRLLRQGRVTLTAVVERFVPSFFAQRAPRTLAGVGAGGRLLLVTVDGRRPSWSAGLTLLEAARTMRALGAREAVNLDGGGSTTMAIRGKLVNRPSDPGGERPVGDALLVQP